MEIIREILSANGIEPTDAQMEKLSAFCRILKEYNEKFNLTNITDVREMAVKHLVDSIKGMPYLPEEGKIIDVGSGAGFPSIPLIIMNENPGRSFVLLDSLRKRVDFLTVVIDELRLSNAVAVHARAEEEAKRARNGYDCAVARAVAPLNILLEYTLPLVKKGGAVVAYKGRPEEEIRTARNALRVLGGEIRSVEKYVLNGEYERSFVIVEKTGETPVKYPRGQNKPRIMPL